MVERKGRANLAMVFLVLAAIVGLDVFVYGAEQGYNTALAFSYMAGFVSIAVALFGWNVATYKR